MKIRGVNLGNWLVLEKWMSPALYEGTTAMDEFHLPLQLPKEIYEARMRIHRSEYITERDFACIRRMGLNAVRIPIPYFIFGDRPPFLGCIEELDRAFAWAEKYGLKILLDLHAVPMSQNGFDNGGICGVCMWHTLPDEVEFVLKLLEKLAQRYGQRDGLLGIQPINEPCTEGAWKAMDVPHRFVALEPEWAEKSGPVPMDFLRQFYLDAYDRIRRYLPEEKPVVFHDGFVLDGWKDFFAENREHFRNVILDTHQYLMMAELDGCEQTKAGYLRYIEEVYKKDFAAVQAYVPVICGEWSLFNSLAVGVDTHGGQSVLNGEDVPEERTEMSAEEKADLYRTLARAQMDAWEAGAGWFYWSYKLLLDTVNDPAWYNWDSWDLAKSWYQGWFPMGE